MSLLLARDEKQQAELVVWNPPLVTFRSPIGFSSVHERLLRAKRFADLPIVAFCKPIKVRPAKVDDFAGMMLYASDYFLFGLAEHDLDPASGDSMDEVSKQAVTQVRELFVARSEAENQDLMLRGVARPW